MKKIFTWCRRYISLTFIFVIGFVLMVLFFNDNSILKSMEYNARITELKQEIQSNRDTMEYYHRLNHSLNTDKETMERIVREQYHMQRENEDVYIIE
jgi:cell division protein FtsB